MASRKRPRSSPSPSSNVPDDRPILTPHILRLLRLVEDGTADHAKMAATHLSQLTEDCSPLVLWEILGRLQAFLVSKQWNTRSNAGLAMEGVAQHLPLEDQEAFLSQDYRYYTSHSLRNEDDAENAGGFATSLTVYDLEGNLPTVLEKGRLLVAAAESRFQHKEEDGLDDLNESSQGYQNFCEMRLEMQRRILTRRLGLSNVLARYTNDCDPQKKQLINQEDLEGPDVIRSDTGAVVSNRKKKQKRKRKSDSAQSRLSISALLTREIKQQKQHNDGHEIVSHRTAQALLAGELMFRIFDPSWHVRHGSLIGILALIRAWKAHQRSCESEINFGAWPQDILARVLCVLALDRFGDYSGASAEAVVAGGMVAPVREMAGQVFALVFSMSPPSLKQTVQKLLNELLQHEEWETRHGALLAIKYTTVLVTKTSKMLNEKDCEDYFLGSSFANQVICKLEDPNDDVQGVAAQILAVSLYLFDFDRDQDIGSVTTIIHSLWKALENIRVVSSSVHDLVKLFSKLIRRDVPEVLQVVSDNTSLLKGLVSIFSRTIELLDCELVSVKVCILDVIGALSKELEQIFDKKIQSSMETETDNTTARKCYSKVVQHVYELYRATSFAVRDNGDDSIDGNTDILILNQSCKETWAILSDISGSVFSDGMSEQKDLTFDLLSKYFQLGDTSKINRDLPLRAKLDHATILVRFFCSRSEDTETPRLKVSENVHTILEFHLLSCLDSPFLLHFEAACLLIQAMSKNEKLESLPMLKSCQRKLSDKLQKQEPSQFHKNSNLVMHDSGTQKAFSDCFYIGYTMISKQNYSAKVAAAAVVALWKEAGVFPKNNTLADITVDSMRLSSNIVGTLITGGIDCLPTKLTPIVRPLMTSIQNEADEQCQDLTCSYMESFLKMVLDEPLSSQRYSGLRKTFLKVLTNLCRLVQQGKKPSCIAASKVIGLLVSKLQTGKQLSDLPPVWQSVLSLRDSQIVGNIAETESSLYVMKAVSLFLGQSSFITANILDDFMDSLVNLACSKHDALRKMSSDIIGGLCSIDLSTVLQRMLPGLLSFLRDKNETKRSGACMLLRDVLDSAQDISIVCPYVKVLLPIAMSMMIDSVRICAEISASIFSTLVRIAPLVKESVNLPGTHINKEASLVIDHLIHGKKLSPCKIHPKVAEALCEGNIILRNYQQEGVSWLRFLQRINLNGALCDSMGLGKTLQALLGVSLAHMDCLDEGSEAKSLVVCPASIVGHWVNEVERYFPRQTIFRALAFVGNSQQRSSLLKAELGGCNLVVTSYEILRSEIGALPKVDWTYCILDEGHLLRNPKTATARASRKLRARHKLILTGTPIQNSVNEVWATFDFLMPNFLGSSSHFSKQFSKPIMKGQNLDARAADIAAGMEKLKLLHQQVLPFILRREKEQVLKELPPKIITRIPCPMSSLQEALYERFCSNQQGKQSISSLNAMIDSKDQDNTNGSSTFSPDVLKALLYLRLLCTHPRLVRAKNQSQSTQTQDNSYNLEVSGKLVALKELLRDAGLNVQNLTGADNDTSLLYCDKGEDQDSDVEDHEKILEPNSYSSSNCERIQYASSAYESRCLIFAQFTHSLDVVEELLIKRYMPSVKYLRLDGKVPISKRSTVVDQFNQDETFKLMLLTTKVGGLGLNLTGADTVIFLEHDWNPHSDLQAMDRAHRIGQKRTVHVYQLVTMDSIEEKTMLLQEKKLAMSKAIVNTDNSSMYSMGTDRLLDIFQFRSESSKSTSATDASDLEDTLDALVDRYQNEYQSLSLNDFLAGFEGKKVG